MPTEDTTTPQRPGWRDVYEAVTKSEERIIAHIDNLVTPMRNIQQDHETRLRAIEQGQTHWQQEMSTRQAHHGTRIGANESSIKTFRDREQGIFSTLNFGQRLLVFMLAALGGMLTVLNIVSIAVGK
jgi:hypothetical protein